MIVNFFNFILQGTDKNGILPKIFTDLFQKNDKYITVSPL